MEVIAVRNSASSGHALERTEKRASLCKILLQTFFKGQLAKLGMKGC